MTQGKFKLANGMKVIYCCTPEKGVLAAEAIIDAGSLYEKDVPKGTAHFLEHIAGDSINKYLNFEEGHVGVYSWLGASFTTGLAEMVFGNAPQRLMLKEDFETFLYALKGILDVDIEKDVVERERKRILAEYKQAKDRFERQKDVTEMVVVLLGKDSPYNDSFRTLGTPDTIRRINCEDLEKYKKMQLTPDKLTLYLSGDIPQNIEEIVEEKFSDIKRGPQVKRIKLPETKWVTTGRYETYDDVKKEVATALLLFPVPNASKPNSIRAHMVVNMLSDEVFNLISKKGGLGYDAGARCTYVGNQTIGTLHAVVNNDRKTINKAYKLMWQTIEKVRAGNIPRETLKKIAHACKTDMANDRANNVNERLNNIIMEDRQKFRTEDYYEIALNMNEEGIKKAARKILPQTGDGTYLEYLILPHKK